MSDIGILVTATNAYLPLGVRLIKQFRKRYKGNDTVTFFLIADRNPADYMDTSGIVWTYRKHTDWANATESRFQEFEKLSIEDLDYVYWLDADTAIDRDIDLEWLKGETVVCEHFGNKSWLGDKKNYDRNPACNAYVPLDDPREKTYYMGMLWGGRLDRVIPICRHIIAWVNDDHSRGVHAAVQDESYINKYFLENPPDKVVPWEQFPLVVSDKGGIADYRNVKQDVSAMLADLAALRNHDIEIRHGKVIKA